MSGSGKGLLGLWLYRSGEQEWAVKEGSPLHHKKETFELVKTADNSKNDLNPNDRTSIVFTLKNQVGGLARALQVFQEMGINVLHIDFHHTNESSDVADVLVDVECDAKHLEQVIRLLKREVHSVNYASTQANADIPPPTPLSACGSFGN